MSRIKKVKIDNEKLRAILIVAAIVVLAVIIIVPCIIGTQAQIEQDQAAREAEEAQKAQEDYDWTEMPQSGGAAAQESDEDDYDPNVDHPLSQYDPTEVNGNMNAGARQDPDDGVLSWQEAAINPPEYDGVNSVIPIGDGRHLFTPEELNYYDDEYYETMAIDFAGRPTGSIVGLTKELLTDCDGNIAFPDEGSIPMAGQDSSGVLNLRMIYGPRISAACSALSNWFVMTDQAYNVIQGYVDQVVDYAENGGRSLIRVIPVYTSDLDDTGNLIAKDMIPSGFNLFGYSRDDNGQTVNFGVYVPNAQAGYTVNYETGTAQAN